METSNCEFIHIYSDDGDGSVIPSYNIEIVVAKKAKGRVLTYAKPNFDYFRLINYSDHVPRDEIVFHSPYLEKWIEPDESWQFFQIRKNLQRISCCCSLNKAKIHIILTRRIEQRSAFCSLTLWEGRAVMKKLVSASTHAAPLLQCLSASKEQRAKQLCVELEFGRTSIH